MSTALEMTPTQTGNGAERVKKTYRGTETRQRSARMILSLLPAEKDVAGVIAHEYGKSSIQALLIDACGPLMSSGTLEALAADREQVQAVAVERGISEVQALLLLALTTPSTGGERIAG
jgi:hypothetical protein